MANGKVPLALRRGDTVAFISPSARLNHIFPAPLNRAKSHLVRLGYHDKLMLNHSEPLTFRHSILPRYEEIRSAFADPSINAIICTVGGSHANELLPYLDYELIRMNPKIFCGYSDITVLHHALFTQASLRTFYGPAAGTELGDYPQPLQFAIEHLLYVLQDSVGKPIGPVPRSLEWAAKLPDIGTDSQRPREQSPSPGWTWLRPGKAIGHIFGGCLPFILHLAGPKSWPHYRDRILLLENPMGEKMEDPFSLTSTRAKIADPVNLEVFEQSNGAIVGRPYAFDEEMRDEFAQLVKDQCYGTNLLFPLNVDVGHTDPLLTVPVNAMVGLDSEKDEFIILEAGVCANNGD
ncbi:MAG: hypothetical protein ALECFALPRED_009716 [Alectoria fallacina]|uniref:Peptidase S66, LD-carboxypeptidase A n=1 Tax=Alectoria fallacina TaxID=1903189 RepID=A0A8H3J7S3_9LECA|nr:MAG: hypothetical protein ALECFALPRED_009716 [Alectoria fallacina]